MHHPKNIYYAFKNATVYTDYQSKIENAIVLIKDDKIIAVGTDVKIPENASVIDLQGNYIYPSFIELDSDYGLPELKKKNSFTIEDLMPQYETKKQGAYSWNEAIKPEQNAFEQFSNNTKNAKEYLSLGFGTVLTHIHDGIMRGTSALVSLADKDDNLLVIKDKAANHLSFKKGTSRQAYPSSQMGAIALIRQTYYDAQWYATTTEKKEFNISLDAINQNKNLPAIFETSDYLEILRADKIGDEFNIQYIFRGNGDEYKRIDDIKKTNGAIILPLAFPEAYDVTDPFDARVVSLEELKHWELAPFNPRIIAQQQIPFAFSTRNLKDKKDFLKNLREAVNKGLSEQDALKALTLTPAQLLKVEDKVGAVKKGYLANFIITNGNIFDSKTVILENWTLGQQHIITDKNLVDVRGKYHLNINKKIYELTIDGDIEKPSGKIIIVNDADTQTVNVKVKVENNLITLSFNPKDEFSNQIIRLSGLVHQNSGILDGKALLNEEQWFNWSAIKNQEHTEKEKKETPKDSIPPIPAIWQPNMAYGWQNFPPQQKTILIKNATVWTNEKEGILENTDILISNGKIAAVGKNITAPKNGEVIDATGKHVTPGIIDEHSHIAISKGVNEGSEAISAEVRIGDVVNSDDINIYRQISGGVVISQLLHGSANPIGGQSAIIKLKWGYSPEEMKMENAPKFIKFALGENVKQSNWGDFNTTRYPQTRMGVEQLYYDAFWQAKAYEEKWKAYNNLPKKLKAKTPPPRKDLRLETLVEILNGERFITCHSYVQSEINMLMHVADSMGFKINTFTHILEGYKVADKLKEHGAGGSTFSDWWAYKFEVNDAIPYNGALMYEKGIVVAFNSDDAEMGRRLNQEAAKAVKYGGVPEEEALKFVTLNPAKLLHIDDRTGSIKVGKEANLVIWTDKPLSVYAKTDKTLIDGIVFYDAEKDKLFQEYIKKERNRLIQKMLDAKNNGQSVQKPEKKKKKLYHCDTMEENF
jgi:imidazolonepropionase-like amidohydrolase